MNVGTEPRVIRQVPAGMVGIVINDDVVVVPIPVVAVTNVRRSDAEEKAAEPEPLRTTTSEPVDVARANPSPKMSVLPGMIEVVTRVIAACVVSDPAIRVGVHVRGVGVSCLLGEITTLRALWSATATIGRRCRRCGRSGRSRGAAGRAGLRTGPRDGMYPPPTLGRCAFPRGAAAPPPPPFFCCCARAGRARSTAREKTSKGEKIFKKFFTRSSECSHRSFTSF